MPTVMRQPSEVHLTEPIAPRPYPGCKVCAALVKEWVAVTEPASPQYSLKEAFRLVDEIKSHRADDEASAPAL
ncbi:hypothetical protein [Streptomyces sp. NBC_00236]|uniref:hypothetical protein n=1 Tax=Streptomyces sp. NBC_00236 TaxID=2903639 RepID=UPI002E2BFFA9|nr:hypothetical protein [Streptomyces sp. NBC_00236]